MTELVEKRLCDIGCVFISGFGFKSSDYSDKGIPLIKIGNIQNRIVTIDKNGTCIPESIVNEKIERVFLYDNDVLIAMTGQGSVGRVGRLKLYNNKQALLNQRVGKFICDEKTINLDYLYYILTSDKYQDYLFNTGAGSGQPNLSPALILQTEIPWYEYEKQKAIAEVLSSLDDKIDLLHRQNKTLEQMAETLFRQWFVEEAGEDWDILYLSDIAEIKNGFSFSSKSYIEYESDVLEVFKMGHIEKGGGLRQNPKKNYVPRYEKIKKHILNKGDIVMAMTDMKDNVVILGVPAMIDKRDHYVLNQRVARICLRHNSKIISNYLLYIQLNDKENIALLQSKANSGVQVNLSTQAIRDIEIIVPPIQIQQEKGQVITDFYLKKEKNQTQIRTIESLRDTLLPKLMNGEVRMASNG